MLSVFPAVFLSTPLSYDVHANYKAVTAWYLSVSVHPTDLCAVLSLACTCLLLGYDMNFKQKTLHIL